MRSYEIGTTSLVGSTVHILLVGRVVSVAIETGTILAAGDENLLYIFFREKHANSTR